MSWLMSRMLLVAVPIALAAAAIPAMTRAESGQLKLRQAAMKQNGDNLKAIAAFFKGRAGTTENVALRAGAIASVAARLPDYFRKATGADISRLQTTAAKPEIWSDWDGFVAASENLRSLALDLARAARRGDRRAIKVATVKLARQGCGGCHRNFRKPRRENQP